MPGSFLFFFVEMGSSFVAQAGLELLGSSYPPLSASQSAAITSVSHWAWPIHFFFFLTVLFLLSKLECNGVTLAYRSLSLLGSSDSPASAS